MTPRLPLPDVRVPQRRGPRAGARKGPLPLPPDGGDDEPLAPSREGSAAFFDDTMGPAVVSIANGRGFTTVSLNVTYLRATRPGEPVVCEATVVKHGRTQAYAEATLTRESDGGSRARDLGQPLPRAAEEGVARESREPENPRTREPRARAESRRPLRPLVASAGAADGWGVSRPPAARRPTRRVALGARVARELARLRLAQTALAIPRAPAARASGSRPCSSRLARRPAPPAAAVKPTVRFPRERSVSQEA